MNGIRRTVRGLIGSLVETAADAIRSIAPTEPAVEFAPDPADVYTADELPETEVIEAAAREYERAADQARRADRGKRAARKVLDRLPAGRYGAWIVERVTSSRETADLDAIRATYKRLGLGPVPMKRCAPSLKVERLAGEDAPQADLAAIAALAVTA
ncbi:hypothetical protein ACIQB5_06765 [Streptomyces sp. NPDC088560]|uniref:hypothetical protein n=1 Tax=Streptomyces sp. NPDC088560 TaxID=3365868 RepID=UPI003801ECEB